MENKQLEQQFLNSDGVFDELSNSDAFMASKACSTITLEHMKGFREWSDRMNAKNMEIKDIYRSNPDVTTEQLIELYFKSLNK